jgi:hypothetical protein
MMKKCPVCRFEDNVRNKDTFPWYFEKLKLITCHVFDDTEGNTHYEKEGWRDVYVCPKCGVLFLKEG